MNAAKGLGDSNPFQRRQEAAAAFLPSARESGDDEYSGESNDLATGVARKAETLPPPPAKETVARVQWNIRVLPDQMKKVKAYQRKYGVTLQAIADQMVQEYLEAHGLI